MRVVRSAALVVTFELDAEDDAQPSLVSVSREDGAVEKEREDGWLTDVEWFRNDWSNGGPLILDGLVDADSLKRYRKLVAIGHMWSSASNTPDMGEDYESGFVVDKIITSVPA